MSKRKQKKMVLVCSKCHFVHEERGYKKCPRCGKPHHSGPYAKTREAIRQNHKRVKKK